MGVFSLAKFRFTSDKKRKALRIFRYNDAVDSVKKISGAKIEMFSNREISVDGCKGIAEYSDVYTKIKITGGIMIITGKNLDIPIFDGPLITVTGKIETIEFCVR